MTAEDLRALDIGHRYRFEFISDPPLEAHLVAVEVSRCSGHQCRPSFVVVHVEGQDRVLPLSTAEIVGAVLL